MNMMKELVTLEAPLYFVFFVLFRSIKNSLDVFAQTLFITRAVLKFFRLGYLDNFKVLLKPLK